MPIDDIKRFGFAKVPILGLKEQYLSFIVWSSIFHRILVARLSFTELVAMELELDLLNVAQQFKNGYPGQKCIACN